MKYLLLVVVLLLSGCQPKTQADFIEGFSEELSNQLRESESLYNKVKNECTYKSTVKQMMEADLFDENKVDILCDIELKQGKEMALSSLMKSDLSSDTVKGFIELPFYRSANTERYLDTRTRFPEFTNVDVVVYVNIGVDRPYFTDVQRIDDLDDKAMLVNKYSALPGGYEPPELIVTPSPCAIGYHYSCSTNDPQYVEKTAGEHFLQLVEAANEEGIKINSIASYRTYEYQRNLYNYNLNLNGQEYTDLYYARPGQSEHNSGLAIDVTMNDLNYNEIHLDSIYPWLIDNMAEYGFILRYPEDKTHLTGFGYESWHLRYVGKDIAKTIMENNWCLEEYYARKESD